MSYPRETHNKCYKNATDNLKGHRPHVVCVGPEPLQRKPFMCAHVFFQTRVIDFLGIFTLISVEGHGQCFGPAENTAEPNAGSSTNEWHATAEMGGQTIQCKLQKLHAKQLDRRPYPS